ncbi:phosphoenolpyruvate-utilizing N-terminal domain-containing protein, partial [Geobacillus sp. G4]
MIQLSGIAASNGIAIAKAYRLEEPDLTVSKKEIQNIRAEIERFEQSVES